MPLATPCWITESIRYIWYKVMGVLLEIANTPNNGQPSLLNDDTPPKQVMWEKILADYSPSNHPSQLTCAPPDGNKPPSGIQGAIAM